MIPFDSTKSHFMLAAPASGSGKTTLTLGLLRALTNRGLTVQPFKCGPDYIDTLHHTTAARSRSINLDVFMASEDHVVSLYGRYSAGADVAVTEGVMGLFDGSDRAQGSSAAVAQLLDLPVILVINAKAMAYSVAPLLYGFKNFDERVNVVGVIFNFVSTPSHYRFLKEAAEDVGVEPLGYLPPQETFAIPSRHLGLHISAETDYETIIQTIADEIPKTIDLDRLLAVTAARRAGLTRVEANARLTVEPASRIRIAIARDEAFTFTYGANIDVLSAFGAITYFSPLRDAAIPPTDLLYLPGGYPELAAEALSGNDSMRESIRTYCRQGGLTYAECGGLMYLGTALTNAQGQTFPMVGVLDTTTTLQASRLTLGYRVLHWNGHEVKGHEFHYSRLNETAPQTAIASVTNARGAAVATPVYRVQNTFASYLHLYWAHQPAFIQALLDARS